MLLRQQGGRHQHSDLLAGVCRHEGSAHGHFGLAEANIATDQAVHGFFTDHVLEHSLNGRLLVRGFLKGETGGEGTVGFFGVFKGKALAGLPARVDIQ